MTAPLAVRYPFRGDWVARNSPADRIPSHGTTLFGSALAIDFVGVDAAGRSAPVTFSTLVRPEPPDAFAGFGRALLAPADAEVVAASDGAPDHPAHRGLPSLGYALTQRRRLAAGWPGLAGNHVLLRCEGGAVVALCHLQAGSVLVRPGARVRAGEPVGRCGNSGNSTEPHVHVQAVDRLDLARARPVPLLFDGGTPRSGRVVHVA
ncbi:M23 family metallopeptidase [Propioniciclava coleopterorum]|uniref:M23 family metallopeptidase n=1 Tax=Propioniciclava coleopterorum TaxID=2714937 RepID=A0A6G7Y5K9_9ACTN|nr:M23 family metallopeptidase [Propioniciclava coleopterorum]QIK71928.1 M23 family metallopeptidase [Propioniciclava coleopterorum]